jgi:hypothetical protein
MNIIPNNNTNNTNNTNNANDALSTSPASTTPSLNYSTNTYNNIKGSSDNVMPYYDEELEQYFNINNLNDEVKYNSYAYMSNTNKQSYTNNDTSQYTNNSNIPKNGNNLLNNNILDAGDKRFYHPGPRTASGSFSNVSGFVPFVPQRPRYLMIRLTLNY